jgi:hypothetical protein
MRNLHSESIARRWRLLLIALVALLVLVSACEGIGIQVVNQYQTVPAIPRHAPAQDTRADFDALPVPDGVDPALYAQLKDALYNELLKVQSGKNVSQPPSGVANQVADLELAEDEGAYYLSWSYRNLGDYDQDGAVGISDITPIAMYYGQDVPDIDGDPDDYSIQAVVDGSGNGTVDIADITPIAMSYGTSVDGYAVQTSADEAQTWDDLSPVLVGSATGDGRAGFEVLLDTPVERNIYHVVPYFGEEFGDDSNAVRYFTSELVLILETPAESGAGTAEDPYVVLLDTPYELRVEDDESVDVSASVTFDTMPPAFIAFTAEEPRLMTVENIMAGDFTVVALLGEIAPMPSGDVYFRAQGDLPP